jgi:DNA-binding response OmpR family regulator
MMRILLIEDDRMIGAAVMQALKDAAYAVDWVMDGQTAIDAAEAEVYDLALLDLSLPAVDGLDVLRRLRQGGRMLPVVVVTARDGIDDSAIRPMEPALTLRYSVIAIMRSFGSKTADRAFLKQN